MKSWLIAARCSLIDGFHVDALAALQVALTYCPKGSKEWSRVMLAIRMTRRALNG